MAKTNKSKSKSHKSGQGNFKKRILLALLKFGIAGTIILITISFFIVGYYSVDLPNVEKIYEIKKQPTITIYDSQETILANYGDLYGRNLQYHQIPKHLIEAIISIEDRRFFTHFGIDIIGIMRAFYVNQRAGRVIQGGSTITQQLAKISFLTPERTFRRKIQEILLAIKLEKKYKKEEILSIYINRVYLGKGNYGLDAASRYYFGKYAEKLTLYESAILAGMLKGPVKYSPSHNFTIALKRAKLVLNNMEEEGYISKNDIRHAVPPKIIERGNARGVLKNPYFTDYVLERISGILDNIDQDLKVYTTLNLEMQNQLEQSVQKNINFASKKNNVSQAAAVVIDNRGKIVALVGGVDYSKSQFNRAVSAYRQPGSEAKLFVYIAALENGYTTDSVVEDSQVKINKWVPKNFNRAYLGKITLEEAFAKSINTVAVKLSESVGRQKVIDVAKRLGINEKIANVPSLALGSEVTSLLSLTTAFAHIANNGFQIYPYSIVKVINKNNKIIYEHVAKEDKRIISPNVIQNIKKLLAAVVQFGTGKNALLPGEIYGKTGTTQDHRDAWFIGFNNTLTLGVWVGNDNNAPMKGISGGSIPAFIWKDFMQQNMKADETSIWNSVGHKSNQGKSIFDFFSSIFSQPKKSETIDSIIEKNLQH